MKNRGFTLIELLAVIVILGLLATVTTPIIISTLDTSKQKACLKQKEEIEKAAERWGIDNAAVINKENISNVSLETLKSEGYLKSSELVNPKDKTLLTGSVTITRENAQYKYIYNLTCD